jgi:O-antigen/teichoic acid export membrane protein
MLGQLGLALSQGVQFLLVARAVGPYEFGKVSSILAITGALLPFSGLGSANTMVMHLVRGAGEERLLYGNALFAGLCTGVVLTALASLGTSLFASDSQLWLICVIFGLSELVVTKLVDISQHVFLGLERHVIASRFLLSQSVCRLLAAVLMSFAVKAPTALQWSVCHLVAGVVAACCVIGFTVSQTGRLSTDLRRLAHDVRTGIFFSLSLSARSVYTDIDKAVLAHSASLSINGAYTAAFRLVFMATTPLTAGLVAIQAKMFRAGGGEGGGLRRTTDMAKRAIFVGVIYGGVVGTGLYVAAPWLPLLLGAKYTASIEMLQMLAFLPIPLFIQSALSDALCAANFQRVRSLVQIGVAGLSFGLNTMLVKELSWRGAVLATYCCQFALVLMMTYMVVRLLSKDEAA